MKQPNRTRLAHAATILTIVAAMGLAGAPGVAAQSATATQLPTGEQVFDRFMKAVGGDEAFRKHDSHVLKGTLNMAAQGMTGKITSYRKAPDKLLNIIELPGLGTMTQGYDGKVFWAKDPMQGPRLLTGSEADQLLMEIAQFGEGGMRSVYKEIETQGRESFKDNDSYKVRMVTRTGMEMTGFFAVDSGLQLGTRMEMDTPMGKIPMTIVMADYRDFSGMKMPAKTTQEVMGQRVVFTIDSIETDVADLPSFTPPPEVMEMVGN